MDVSFKCRICVLKFWYTRCSINLVIPRNKSYHKSCHLIHLEVSPDPEREELTLSDVSQGTITCISQILKPAGVINIILNSDSRWSSPSSCWPAPPSPGCPGSPRRRPYHVESCAVTSASTVGLTELGRRAGVRQRILQTSHSFQPLSRLRRMPIKLHMPQEMWNLFRLWVRQEWKSMQP